jgi:hypothetical protein
MRQETPAIQYAIRHSIRTPGACTRNIDPKSGGLESAASPESMQYPASRRHVVSSARTRTFDKKRE